MNHGLLRFIAPLLLALLSVNAQAVEEVIYYHNDALGSPIAATDQEGRVVWRKSYAPYGQPIGPSAPNEPGYTGKFEEPELGIQDFGARWYDPRIGRFLAIDPVGFDPQNAQSFNRYAYANNNPYGFVDPDGRAPRFSYQWNFDAGIAGGSLGGMAVILVRRLPLVPRVRGQQRLAAEFVVPCLARRLQTARLRVKHSLRTIRQVTKPLQVKAGEIAPAYGQPGLGTQFVTDQAIRDLIGGGYLKKVEP